MFRGGDARLTLAPRGAGNDVALICAAPLLAALAAGAWAAAPLLGVALGMTSAAVTVLLGRRQVRASRLATALCATPDQAPKSLLQALQQVASRLADANSRLANRHPVTGLPTREHLFQAVSGKIDKACEPGLLAVFRLTDFDRLAAFDQTAADRALGALARRLTNGLSADRTIAQVDRDSIAVWFGLDPVLARREAQSIAYVASQTLDYGDTVLTPSLEMGFAAYRDAKVTATDIRLKDGQSGFRIVHPILYAGRNFGMIEVSISKAELESAAATSRNLLIGLSFIVLTVVGLVSFALARLLSRPVLRLKSAMADAAMGDLNFRISHDRKDEFGRLFDGFNILADVVQERLAAAERPSGGPRPLEATQISLEPASVLKSNAAGTPFDRDFKRSA